MLLTFLVLLSFFAGVCSRPRHHQNHTHTKVCTIAIYRINITKYSGETSTRRSRLFRLESQGSIRNPGRQRSITSGLAFCASILRKQSFSLREREQSKNQLEIPNQRSDHARAQWPIIQSFPHRKQETRGDCEGEAVAKFYVPVAVVYNLEQGR